ncbi:MAG TPA: hypothetical protein VNB49_10955 [Candidatus Dormibacteraeota bacterium]|nr:hypothetical protein [Candidatus Dormibacteraeota bacterium]
MITMLTFAILAILTMFAVAAAAALSWMFLRFAFSLMQPATAPRVPPRTEPRNWLAPTQRIAERPIGQTNACDTGFAGPT